MNLPRAARNVMAAIHALLLGGLLAFQAGPALAVQPGEALADPKLEARARTISAEIRCLVCQNQSIDDSDAPLAHDLRVIVRQRLLAGDRDGQVREFIVARYGDYVLLRPPVNSQTLLLWFGPPLILLAAIGGLFLNRRARPVGMPPQLTTDEEARLAALLADGDEPSAVAKPRSV